jgi:cytochrome c oxidase subunit 2
MAHFVMRGRVVVDERKDFDAWLAQQSTYAQTVAATAGDVEAGKALFATCTACHGAQAEGNRQLNAPKLSGQASWYLARQLRDFQHGVRGAHESDVYGKQMIPFASMLADDSAIKNVVAYIRSLPETRPDATVFGDPDKGRSLYGTCAACHGADGKGVWSTNAPRLSNMSDWYMARQLQNFQQGIRGSHPQDFSGSQMVSMARVLANESAVSDLLDYVHSL